MHHSSWEEGITIDVTLLATSILVYNQYFVEYIVAPSETLMKTGRLLGCHI